MFFQTAFLTLLPVLALAAPSANILTRGDDLQTCCYTIDNINEPVFVTTGDGQFTDTTGWCIMSVKRDDADPNNCSKASAEIYSGACPKGDKGKVIDCPAN